MQRKTALDLQIQQLQPDKAASAAAAAAELAATAAAHQTYPYGIPEHLLQQEQQQQQQQHNNAEGSAEQGQDCNASADCHARGGPQPDGQCIAEIDVGSAAAWQSEALTKPLPESSHLHGSTTALEQQSQQQASSVQAQHGEGDSRQLQPAAGAQSAPHVTWREEPDQQAAAAHSSTGGFAAASGCHDGGWHGLVVDCSSPGDDMCGSEQLHDEDAQAALLLQRPNTGSLQR
jgi:hypothetical protein